MAIITLAAVNLNGAEGTHQTTNNGPIRTDFFRGPALTPQELDTVIQLAKQCGIEQPASIADVRVLPDLKSVARSLVVTSSERVQARKASHYCLFVGCTNWSHALPAPGAMRLGKFYANSPQPSKTEVTLFTIGTNVVRVSLAQDIPLVVADVIIGKFVRREVRLSHAVPESDWLGVEVSEPTALRRERRTNDYRINFGHPTRRVVGFDYLEGNVVITYVSSEVLY